MLHLPPFVCLLLHPKNVKSSAKELLRVEGQLWRAHLFFQSQWRHTLTETILPHPFHPLTLFDLTALCQQFPTTTSKILCDNISRIPLHPVPLLPNPCAPPTPPLLSFLSKSKQTAWFPVLWLATAPQPPPLPFTNPPRDDRNMQNWEEGAENHGKKTDVLPTPVWIKSMEASACKHGGDAHLLKTKQMCEQRRTKNTLILSSLKWTLFNAFPSSDTPLR